jgi:hypothetical protein
MVCLTVGLAHRDWQETGDTGGVLALRRPGTQVNLAPFPEGRTAKPKSVSASELIQSLISANPKFIEVYFFENEPIFRVDISHPPNQPQASNIAELCRRNSPTQPRIIREDSPLNARPDSLPTPCRSRCRSSSPKPPTFFIAGSRTTLL